MHSSNDTYYTQGCLIGAVLVLLFAIVLAVPFFFPRHRAAFWGGGGVGGLPMSPWSHGAWALSVLAFAVVLAGEGLRIEWLHRHAIGVLWASFGILLLAGLLDTLLRRKRK